MFPTREKPPVTFMVAGAAYSWNPKTRHTLPFGLQRHIIVLYRIIYQVGTVAVDEWAVTFGTARSGVNRLRPRAQTLLAVPNVTAHPSTASV